MALRYAECVGCPHGTALLTVLAGTALLIVLAGTALLTVLAGTALLIVLAGAAVAVDYFSALRVCKDHQQQPLCGRG